MVFEQSSVVFEDCWLIEGTSVHVRSRFLRARNALSTNASGGPLYVMSSALYGFKSLLQENLQVDSWRFAMNTCSNHDNEIRILKFVFSTAHTGS